MILIDIATRVLLGGLKKTGGGGLKFIDIATRVLLGGLKKNCRRGIEIYRYRHEGDIGEVGKI